MQRLTTRLAAVRSRLTFANVTAGLALFIALGGTSYAVTALPKDSVGRKQLRSKAVGPKELAPRAVTSRTIKNGTVRAADLSPKAVADLKGATGPQGPAGVALRASVDAAGQLVGGNANSGGDAPGDGAYTVSWGSSTSGCTAVAALVDSAGSAAATGDGATGVVVRTFDTAGTPANRAFNVLVAC